MVISEDETTEDSSYDAYAMEQRLNDKTKEIACCILYNARENIFKRGGRPFVPLLRFPEVEYEIYENNLQSGNIINVNQQDFRAPSTLGTTIQPAFSVRDDISSDNEEDEIPVIAPPSNNLRPPQP